MTANKVIQMRREKVTEQGCRVTTLVCHVPGGLIVEQVTLQTDKRDQHEIKDIEAPALAAGC